MDKVFISISVNHMNWDEIDINISANYKGGFLMRKHTIKWTEFSIIKLRDNTSRDVENAFGVIPDTFQWSGILDD